MNRHLSVALCCLLAVFPTGLWGAEEITLMLPGNIPLVMVPVPPGTCQMGSPETELGHTHFESPLHLVTIPGFYMAKTEVTQAQWRVLGRWRPPAACRDYGIGDDYPMYCVSWNDIADPEDPSSLINYLNYYLGITHQLGAGKFRLPTEAEWEYAARAGTQTAYFFGDCSGTCSRANSYMWWLENCHGVSSHPVGTKLPNNFGLYDMLGNVWEWVQDWEHPNYDGAPTDGSAWIEPPAVARIIRGGDYGGGLQFCRCAFRGSAPPDRQLGYGFRLAADLLADGPRPGDCEGNGAVSIGEVQQAINMFLEIIPPDCGVDCNRDGMVSIGEAQKVINGFLGLAAGC